MSISLGVIVPALNEERNIEALLLNVSHALQTIDYTICIVDDGSTDQTIPIIQSLIAQNKRIHLIQRTKTRSGCQRGGASLCAMQWLIAQTDHAWIAEVDADGAHRPEELLPGVRCIAALGCDVVVASKYVLGSAVCGRSFIRRAVSRCHSLLSRLLLDARLRDYSNSFRFYSRRAATCAIELKPRYTSPVYLLEVMAMWLANELLIVEIPTLYIERSRGGSKVRAVDLVRGVLGALAIGFRYRLGRYAMPDKIKTIERKNDVVSH